MRSHILFTDEIDFIEDAVDELKEQYLALEEEDSLQANKAAIILASPEADMDTLSRLLKEKLDISFVFVSALGIFDHERGFYPDGITMIILTDDEVTFAVTATGNIAENNPEEEIRSAYEKAIDQLNGAPDFAIMYSDYMPDYNGDTLVELFSRIAGIPVYGGVAADMFRFDETFVGTEDGKAEKGIAFLFLKGRKQYFTNIELSVTKSRLLDEEVTGAKENQVTELHGHPALDVFGKAGILDSHTDGNVQLEFIPMPMMITEKTKDGEEYSYLRNLFMVDRQNQSLCFLGKVPEGSRMTLARTNKEIIAASLTEALAKVQKELEGKEGEPHLILCTSCASRYLNLGLDRGDEINIFKNHLPAGTKLAGFYSFGEFCKVDTKDSDYENAFHNSTFTMLII